MKNPDRTSSRVVCDINLVDNFDFAASTSSLDIGVLRHAVNMKISDRAQR
jgi:hypothetical protein